MRLLYLDLDGVLNGHERLSNGYCGICPVNVGVFNSLLAEFSDLKLVISSSWRYLVLSGDMTLRGFENLLLTHGLKCHGRVAGVTGPDEDWLEWDGTGDRYAALQEQGCDIRAKQILAHVTEHQPEQWAVLDDMAVPVPRLVRTNGTLGLTSANAVDIAGLLRSSP
jgi:hypothetical protein